MENKINRTSEDHIIDQNRWEQTPHKGGNRARFWEDNIIPYRYPNIDPWERSPGNDYNEYGRSNQIGRWTGCWRDQMGYWQGDRVPYRRRNTDF